MGDRVKSFRRQSPQEAVELSEFEDFAINMGFKIRDLEKNPQLMQALKTKYVSKDEPPRVQISSHRREYLTRQNGLLDYQSKYRRDV
mmetsp:Transcript_36999/g.56706  ORF Transcript_36999/g.56706 Transcript_36999/m.56706 type:complete len:87 (+) Transcript_36999:675-935(+)